MKYVRTQNGIEKMNEVEYIQYVDSKKKEKTYLEKRLEAYGGVFKQLEFITENGLDVWQAKVVEIKELYPKEA